MIHIAATMPFAAGLVLVSSFGDVGPTTTRQRVDVSSYGNDLILFQVNLPRRETMRRRRGHSGRCVEPQIRPFAGERRVEEGVLPPVDVSGIRRGRPLQTFDRRGREIEPGRDRALAHGDEGIEYEMAAAGGSSAYRQSRRTRRCRLRAAVSPRREIAEPRKTPPYRGGESPPFHPNCAGGRAEFVTTHRSNLIP